MSESLPHKGFTIIEMMVTIVIVSILATVAIPMAEVAARRSKEQDLRYALREIRSAIDQYRDAVEEGRIRISAEESGYPPNLRILVEGVVDAKDPRRARLRFLRRVPRDPFSEPSISPEETWGLRSYVSSADNPRPGRDVYDVYSRSDRAGLNGIPYREW